MKKAIIVVLSLWAHSAMAATCADVGYYCGRYQRIQYIETSGTQYLNTGIPLDSKYDMEMTWQHLRFIRYNWVSGIWTDGPEILLTGMWTDGSNNFAVAKYDFFINDDGTDNGVAIPFDTDIHTTYIYKDKGVWIDDESTLKPANYEMELPSNKNFLVGRRQGDNRMWTGRVYSFIFKDNGQIMAEFIPVYDTETEKYGMYDTVSNQFHGNLGTGDFIGGDFTGDAFPCRNAPANAHYTASGTDNNCPWECDDGYTRTSLDKCAVPCSVLKKLHIYTKSFNIYADRQTSPALVLRYKNETCYINAVPGRGSSTLNVKSESDIFHLVN